MISDKARPLARAGRRPWHSGERKANRAAAARVLLLEALAVAASLHPGAAAASTAALVHHEQSTPHGPEVYDQLVVDGVGAEANRIALSEVPGGGFVVRDTGALLSPGSGCHLVGASTVQCAPASVRPSVSLGAGDDRFDGSSLTAGVAVDGGTGADLIVGGAGGDTLVGATGPDLILAGPGPDALGDGESSGAAVAADTLDGGSGEDRVSYSLRTLPLAIDLAAGRAGESGENDRLRAIEDVEGGQADDTIAGDDLNNVLDGGQGTDTLEGRAGRDELRDAYRAGGGQGDDRIRNARHARCDAGRDTVEPLIDRDEVAADCETIKPFNLRKERLRITRVGSRAPTIRLRSRCERDAGRRGCRATVTVRVAANGVRGAPVVGRAGRRARRGRPLAVSVHLTRRGRRFLHRHPRAPLLVSVRVVEAKSSSFNGDRRTASFIVGPPEH